MLDIWDKIKNSSKDTLIARVIKTWNSAPRKAGSAMIIHPDGTFFGSVSGGCVEGAVIQSALDMLQTGDSSKILSFGVDDETAWSVGLSCGGTIKVLIHRHFSNDPDLWKSLSDSRNNKIPVVLSTDIFSGKNSLITTEQLPEDLPPDAFRNTDFALLTEDNIFYQSVLSPERLIIIGANFITNHLVRLATHLGFEVTVLDPRPIFDQSNRSNMKNVTSICDWPHKVLPTMSICETDYIAFLTHDPKIDDPVYPVISDKNVAYIGALGSRKTHAKRVERLKSQGISEEIINRIHAPIGLDINAYNAAEIALSIAAEIIAVKRKKQD